ncbi:PA3715 family protein [Salegentibacter salarius]|uniref:Uncharacterized protein n=1 Tax=Salegentibacter salarius TaxID=435906 RepID=A0A2N0TND9_9FLAO|nr:hypothetical protein [Salegentibacter salarius]OEY71479.1 hypothetical protein BHS39_04935 [Salegentibacter salarius]PKD16269.1 hypothetical protein APR40_04935 [Salegentibacter salarius]SLJ89809.1 hypothetical protein SAMN05660445_00877 [Salegentibacter salarius]
MRNLLTIIFLTLCLNCISQNQPRQLIEQTAQKVGIQNSEIFSRLSTSQQFDNGTLIVIPEIAEQGDGYIIFNSNIILINQNTGEVKAKFSGQKDWYIDAVSIDKIEIEPKLYQLNETTVAFGLKVFYSNQSRPNPYSSTQLSLYALEENKLNCVLKDFSIKKFNGETDTTCKGEFEEHSKNIQVLDTYTNKFADLEFTDKIEFSERNEDCEKVKEKTRKETEILKYENGEYKNVL